MIDQQNLNRTPDEFEFESELILQSSEKRPARRWIASRRSNAGQYLIGFELEPYIERRWEARFIDHWTAENERQIVGKLCGADTACSEPSLLRR